MNRYNTPKCYLRQDDNTKFELKMNSNDKTKGLSYKQAGVDIEQANTLVNSIKHLAQRTHRPGVLGNIGGFGALFEIPSGYKQPVLVSGTDGVGTKLKIAIEMEQHDTIGIDLVAMCVNDILTLGAEPLYFLDYFATSKLNPSSAAAVISGIAEGCKLANCALIGGETAEMPGIYQQNDYDLAGFCVGVVEKNNIIDGNKIKPGDAIIGLASSGVHSNGYSLVRKIMEHGKHTLSEPLDGSTLGKLLLEPTRIYVSSILELSKTVPLHGLVHITGGGLVENIPRILPKNTRAHLEVDSWTWPVIFQWLQEKGNIALQEMYRTFNLGVGMVVIVAAEHMPATLHCLHSLGETAWQLGTIKAAPDSDPHVSLDS